MQDNENTLNPFRAVATVEGGTDASEEEVIAAWQYLIDTGFAWELQGSIGRQAAKLIEIGVCWAPWQGVDSVPEAM